MQEQKRPKLKKDFEHEDEVVHLCMLPETIEGRTAFAILDRRIVKAEKDLRRNPKRSDDLKEDIAHNLGFIEGLEYLKNLHGNAKEYIKIM